MACASTTPTAMQSRTTSVGRCRRRRDDDHGDRAAGDRAPDRQAAPPDRERAERVVVEELVVGDHVVEARADHSPEDDPERDVVDRAVRVPAVAPAPLGDAAADEHADREEDPVHVERAEVRGSPGSGSTRAGASPHRRSAPRTCAVRSAGTTRSYARAVFSSRPVPDVPGPGQESAWDYPRPPRARAGDRAADRRARRRHDRRHDARATACSRPATRRTTTSRPTTSSPARSSRAKGASFCEWKGRAHYFTVRGGDRVAHEGAWGYDEPEPGVRARSAATSRSTPAAWTRAPSTASSSSPQPGGFYGGWITSGVVGPFKGGPGSRGW